MVHNNHHQWRTMRFSFKNAAQLRYFKGAEETRLAMQPLDLIKKVREIEQEGTGGQETEQQKDVK
ncbi:hypothetical protein F2Q70_00042118 [Brassica cretica]|uniref:Uncharacterized protein n=1 Tax=Brassica cretica TaxID=69181 RepID=A0A8S9K3U8_BRACR|nr:hypothetical protein F2Q70_00042118 [Brassica cretica]KAF2617923.1 hypothetical protein F2Q68_00042793 [Brassica cretica]